MMIQMAKSDVVMMIDVLHHVADPGQRAAILEALQRVADGGRFIYKDMCVRPRWRAAMNQLHDLLAARQWIHTVPVADVIGWAREAWNDMKQFSTGGTYINFLTEDEGADRIEAALRGSLSRLSEVKRKWDPENVFRTNRNIEPAK